MKYTVRRIFPFCFFVTLLMFSGIREYGANGAFEMARPSIGRAFLKPGTPPDSINITDSAYLRYTQAHTTQALAAKSIVLDLFINPVTNEFMLHFSPAVDGQGDIKFYDRSGKLIKLVSDQAMIRGVEQHVLFSTRGMTLQKASYYLLIRDGSETFIKEIIFY